MLLACRAVSTWPEAVVQRRLICDFRRCVELDPERQRRKGRLAPDVQEPASRFLRAAVLGAPNVGKSVLCNGLLGCSVSAVSRKMNTTRKTMTGVLVDGAVQLVVLDTPGLVTGRIGKRHSLDQSFIVDPENALKSAEYMLIVVDASDDYRSRRLGPKLQHLLCRYRHVPAALVLNKVDLVKRKMDLLEMSHKLTKGIVDGVVSSRSAAEEAKADGKQTRIQRVVAAYEREQRIKRGDVPSGNLDLNVDPALLEKLIASPAHEVDQTLLHKCFAKEDGWPYFEAVFMTSALQNDGVEDVKRFLLDKTHLGAWSYHSSVVADEDAVFMVCDVLRAKLLDRLPHEIPYRLKLNVLVWERDSLGTLCIRIAVIAEHERWVKVIVGKGGQTIRQVVADATQEMRNLFQHEVYLRLDVSGRK